MTVSPPLTLSPIFTVDLAIERQVNLRARTKADHPEPFPAFERIADLRPRHDPPGDRPGDLLHDQRRAFALEGPGERLIFRRGLDIPRIEEKAGMMLRVRDLAIHRRPIRVDVEDG